MAIYHLEANIISRSQGKSIVAAGAYRACERILDESTGIVHDYSRKKDLVFAEILLPEGASAWMADRAQLWNGVEFSEKRKDAQLAREVVISLPRELDMKANVALAREFAEQQFVSKGMVADVCIHEPEKDGEKQPHAHILLTTRTVADTGFGAKNRDWNQQKALLAWREAWAESCNLHLARHGHDLRIDHRSYEAQGIDLEPQTKMGVAAAHGKLERYEQHQAIARANGKRILAKPALALDAISCTQATFTEHDIMRFVHRHSADDEQFQAVLTAVKASPELLALCRDDAGQVRYSTQGMVKLERQLEADGQILSQSSGHGLNLSTAETVLKAYSLSDAQKTAFDYAVADGDVRCVVGVAGSGKSYLLGAAREAWQASGFRVQGATLSRVAAENLQTGSGIESFTVANRLVNWAHERERLTPQDILVVDEAGMLGTRQMAQLVDAVKEAQAKLVLVGDWQQLQAIEAGSPFRALAEQQGFAYLDEVRRQKDSWQREATQLLARHETVDALNIYQQHRCVHAFDERTAAMEAMLVQWRQYHFEQPDKSQLLLASKRADVYHLNQAARELLKAEGQLIHDVRVTTSHGQRDFAVGDRVMCLRNEKSLQLHNGALGEVYYVNQAHMGIKLDKATADGKRYVSFDIKDYADIDHGYASTVHKNQGATVDRCALLASRFFDRHLAYTAMSRHRQQLDVYWSRDVFKDWQDVKQVFNRQAMKENALDFLQIPDKTRASMANVGAERLDAARKRLETRAFQYDCQRLAKSTGKVLSFDMGEHYSGTFKGTTKLGHKHYGMFEQKQALLLVDKSLCQDLRVDKAYVFEMDERQQVLKPQALERERGRGMEIGF